jgi:RNA polymerase sigma factor (sigma-70 family)
MIVLRSASSSKASGKAMRMPETPAAGQNGDSKHTPDSGAAEEVVPAWFVREILPLEALLMSYLYHNWHNADEIADLRQDVYTRVFAAAKSGIPANAKAFLFATARNLLINSVKHKRVVPIEAVADPDKLGVAMDAAGPERTAISRDELRRLQAALDRLPARVRQAISLSFIEDLPAHEVAARMGVTKSTVSKQLTNGLRALADILCGEPADRGRKP